jgi:flagellum-specific peptidoglycan hydrolase FlgJ
MKHKSFNWAFGCLCLSIFVLAPNRLIGQPETNAKQSVEAILNGDISAVSNRIALMYGADSAAVERFVQAAVNLERRLGLSAPVVIAIAIHESSFKSELFLRAGNPFGIKASKPWVGPIYTKWADGEETQFRAYNSVEEAIRDLGSFVKSRTWYADVFDCPVDDSRCVIDGLKKTTYEPGYSMNPEWDEAIMKIIQKVGLLSLATR